MLFSICAVNTSSLFKAVAWEPVHFDFVLEFEVSMKVSWKPFHIGKIKERFIFLVVSYYLFGGNIIFKG